MEKITLKALTDFVIKRGEIKVVDFTGTKRIIQPNLGDAKQITVSTSIASSTPPLTVALGAAPVRFPVAAYISQVASDIPAQHVRAPGAIGHGGIVSALPS
jgi:hypothetical protein